MYDVFSAVVSAVSVTQMSRMPFATGCFVFGSTTAYFGSFVPPPGASPAAGAPSFARKRPICAYV